MAGCSDSRWPSELLHVSDDRQCALVGAYEARAAAERAKTHAEVLWAPARANCGDDAGIVAHAPRASNAGCWPTGVSRTPVRAPRSQKFGFLVPACAPTNANELRRDRPDTVGAIGGVCSRSHQVFMNTTRKCTGTFEPGARRTCTGSVRQKS